MIQRTHLIKNKFRVYIADHAIVTVPLGVLQKQHLFSPPLDDKKVKNNHLLFRHIVAM